MSKFAFRYPEWRDIEPASWMQWWRSNYEKLYGTEDNRVHKSLIDKMGSFSSGDFELIGRWKEGCLSRDNHRWKPKTPVAYEVWMQAKEEMPKCPSKELAAEFLRDWSERLFSAGVAEDGSVLRKRFGISRATTVLHFISGGCYPILDSRVAEAMKRLGSPISETIDGYLNTFCPLFTEIAELCGVSGPRDLRFIDNALFCYGLDNIPISLIVSGRL